MKQHALSPVYLLFVLLCMIVCSCFCTELPFFSTPVSNSPYSAFKLVGEQFSQRIKQYVQQSSTLNDRLIPWVHANSANKQIFLDFVTSNRIAFPDYFQEIEGLSEGSGVPLETLLLLNLEAEIDAIIDHDKETARPSDTSCSDIFLHNVNNTEAIVLGHNEDADADIKDYAYMVTINYPTYSLTAYCYPGYLPGNTFGFNSNGMVITTNAEFPKENMKSGIARAFLNRHIYTAKTPEEALAMVQAYAPKLATGFALNVASLKNSSSIFNAEVAPNAMAFKRIEANSYYGHFNQYEYLKVEQHDDPSSRHRAARYNQLTPVKTVNDIYTILGDTEDAAYPIYREGNPPDTDVKTVATAVFDLVKKTLKVYTTNPKTDPKVQLQLFMEEKH